MKRNVDVGNPEMLPGIWTCFDILLIILFEVVLTDARSGIAAFRYGGRPRIGTRVREWPLPWICEPLCKYRKFARSHGIDLVEVM